MKKTIIAFALLFLFNGIAIAEDALSLLTEGGVKSLLVSKEVFVIQVNDQVTGGCLANPGKLKDKMEISLRKKGFGIAKESGFLTNNIIINAVGFKIGESLCAVHISAELIFATVINVPFADNVPKGNETFVSFVYHIGNVIFTGERNSMQSRLSKQVAEFADKLYLDISQSKDDIFTKFPSIKEGIMKAKDKEK